jgi:hypothetical protein
MGAKAMRCTSRTIPILFLLLFGSGALTTSVRGAERERTGLSVSVLRDLLLDKSAIHLKDRCDAARALADIPDATVIRDQRVVEALHYVARDWNDNVLVRLEAMSALGRLPITFTGNCSAYAWPFRWILMDEKEDEVVRAMAAWLLGKALLPEQLNEDGGAAIMSGIVQKQVAIHADAKEES